MTVYTLQAAAPPIPLVEGMVIKLEAIDPVTGSHVPGVTATAWAIYGEAFDEPDNAAQTVAAGPFMLTPGPDSGVA